MGSGAQGLRGSRAHGLKGSRVHGLKGSGAQGFKGSRVQGLMGSGAQGFKGSRVQGFRGSIAASRLSNAAVQRSRISLRSIFNPRYADFNGEFHFLNTAKQLNGTKCRLNF
jgi:hypothetical protein